MMETSNTMSFFKVCFNANCKQSFLEKPKNGWRLRSGDFSELCHRCGSAYEEGKFCETFHFNVSGWRCCETCGKQIHCGCVSSFNMFVLLDAGGIECLTCARKRFILTSNPAWPLPSLVVPSHTERIKDICGKNWSTIDGPGPVPLRKAPSIFSGCIKSQQAKASFEFDSPRSTDILHFSDKMSVFSFEGQNNEDSIGQLLSGEKTCSPDILENRFSAAKSEAQSNAWAIGSDRTAFPKDDTSAFPTTVSGPKNNPAKTSAVFPGLLTTPYLLAKRSSNHNGLDVSTENQAHSGKAEGDAHGRARSLARYLPRSTDQELLRISGENHTITPLFEKTLSASDAGRIGRLILPKNCAEAYLPSISRPEGLPLEVQDYKGNQWLFQFRFWPNNNSRMYVLEGVTSCMQSLELQAGDIVTFGRIEPEGKLIIGGRKASSCTSIDQGNGAVTTIGGISENGMDSKECIKRTKKSIKRTGRDSTSMSKPEEQTDTDVSNCTKGKSSMLACKSRSLMIDNSYMIELNSKEAQGLIRPPPWNAPKVIVIEGCEIEEYEDAPVIGIPSIPSSDYMRSVCSAAQELTAEYPADLLPGISKASFKKMKVSKLDSDSVETSEELDALANRAIREGGASLHATTRHPRHKPGCSCIVCMQPPSKGPKHEQWCDCVVCETVKRRFRTMMTRRREKKQLEKDAEMTSQKMEQDADVDLLGEVLTADQDVVNYIDLSDDSAENETCVSPSRARIDLNSQPEQDKDHLHEPTGRHLEQQQFCPTNVESLRGHDIHQQALTGVMFSRCIAFDGSHERIAMDHHSARSSW